MPNSPSLCSALIVSAVLLSACSETVTGVAKPQEAATSNSGEFADVAGQWVGSYTCTQGDTGLDLVIEPSGRTEFHFFPLPRNAAPASGAFEMQARADAGALEFRQTAWINQPEGYIMVDLVATEQSETTLRGNVVGAGCTTFEVSRDPT